MIGAILGDIIGSIHEFKGTKTKDFELITQRDHFVTDDTYMTLAVAKAVLEAQNDFLKLEALAHRYLLEIGRAYPAGYGSRFKAWLKSPDPQPYFSYGNGAPMRISACGIAYDTLEDVKKAVHAVTVVTHNHPEGLKAAEAVAVAIYYLRRGFSKYELRQVMQPYYNLYTNLERIRPFYRFTEEARYTVPQAILAFLESTDFEDAIRNAVSLGGDADTLGAITGSLAEAYYGVPESLYKNVEPFLQGEDLKTILHAFQRQYPTQVQPDVFYDEPLVFERRT